MIDRLEMMLAHRKNNTPKKQEAINRAINTLLDAEVWDPEARSVQTRYRETYPKLILREEWANQASLLAEKFAKELKMSEAEYITTLPSFLRNPELKSRKGLCPIIVDPRISWYRQAEILGIVVSNRVRQTLEEVTDWGRNCFTSPDRPYSTWVHPADNMTAGYNCRGYRSFIDEEERGGTILEGISTVSMYPHLIKKRTLFVIGTQTEEDTYYRGEYLGGYLPQIYLEHGQPTIRRSQDNRHSGVGKPLFASRKIKTSQ